MWLSMSCMKRIVRMASDDRGYRGTAAQSIADRSSAPARSKYVSRLKSSIVRDAITSLYVRSWFSGSATRLSLPS